MKLHEQVQSLKEENAALRDGLSDLMRYLNSSKFHDDTTVQVRDVLHRIREGMESADNIAFEREAS